MSYIKKAAHDLEQSNQIIYAPRHEYREVDAQSFPHLDLGFYDRTRDALVAQGCTWIGDFEDLTLKAGAIDLRTFIRILVSKDQTISIALYHPKPKFWVRLLLWVMRCKIGRTMDCGTELPEGRYIVTDNASEAAKMTLPPGFDHQLVSVGSDYETVFQVHQQRLKDFLLANPGVQPTIMRTVKDFFAVEHRIEAIKAAYRKEIGGVTEAELKNCGVDTDTAAKVKQEMDRQRSEKPSA
ncbi:MAG TPA: hypothetical protein VNQ90_20715 [Chthoniobacteraceae bacterium]|nr:hypothetical protein [Chthoniobacteraceae bacterium]